MKELSDGGNLHLSWVGGLFNQPKWIDSKDHRKRALLPLQDSDRR